MSGYQTIDSLIPESKKGTTTPKKMSGTATMSEEEKLKRKIKEVGLKEKEIEVKRISASINIPHIDLEKFPIGYQALKYIPREQVEELKTVCFFATPDEFRLGSTNPEKTEVQDTLHELEERYKSHGSLYIISSQSLERAIKQYDRLPNIKPITKDIEIKEEDLEKVKSTVRDFKSLQESLQKINITDTVTFILGAGLKLDASDIHIEAEDSGIHIRLRLDGILQDAAELPKEEYKRLVSRIKLISSLKINITDKPQDGRFTIKLTQGNVDVRVSTFPTVYGESIVMRLLRQDREQITLEKLGLRGRAFDILQREITRPNGMIVTTGPTGSGKTTTLYAIMHILNKPGVKIVSLEDPVEYKMAGINQSQVDTTHDYTFAKGLRSMLRQDPDIAMVGEIRDIETAEIAVQAALTGHLILTTTHTNSASGTIPRFLSMGVKQFLLAPALNCVMAQRLVRQLCTFCKQEKELEPNTRQEVDRLLSALPQEEAALIKGKEIKFFSPTGCEKCNGLGYKGRIGVFEVFVVENEIEKMILGGQISEYDIQVEIIKAGMLTMAQDGVLKAIEGLTSVDEIFRVIE